MTQRPPQTDAAPARLCHWCGADIGHRHGRALFYDKRCRNRQKREKNREKILQRKRLYRAANREKIAELQRLYRADNREKLAEKKRRYHAENIEKFRQHKRTRNAQRALALLILPTQTPPEAP